ncbi:heavy metal-associated isoprenylated plant protein 3 isoform X2 [Manihot esculenta]|uniref:heavy metal-associated isoprenylated plant protein 3 isoform X2 n=1 Tax=Manihot esculenta TaxID=3983 RepID=UPI000B5D373D|nr:heavy metal-associated isoprenylated plant protein 3 isoform X2 [Manihot esculenta]
MGKKKNKNNHEDQDHNHEGEEEVIQKKEAGDGGAKKDGGKNPPTTVFKVEMHCEGCASKIIKMARRLEGVESVKADTTASKLTVIGKVDPSQIREILHQKTKKKVDIISPQPKKEDSNNKNNRDDNKKSSEKKPDAENKKPDADNKKPKEAPVTAAVIKVAFHCLGCIEKIHKIVIKTKGVQEMTLDKQKETVTVKGTMDVKALTEDLKKRLKRPVEIVPPKKEKDAGGGGDKDGKNAGGGNSGQKKNKGGDIQDNAGGGNATAKMEVSKMEYAMQPGFGYCPGPAVGQLVPVYWNGYMGQPVHVPVPMSMPVHEYGYGAGQVSGNSVYMKFNDENSDACLVM